ncbi:hypothetical protein DGo_PE0029 (plasmid) [Deinococcus gobiensis I-0]|uniref:Uncharacterized protein n=1 Tax=Deinococcus gobiensis (strain DSM 21396 / JCM 16679 / CGMCC 1.7299 / I-0) TaxID=745776 RepID=H8H3S6_DEIGI|nr:hypothetical protein DGo_PE0029 [Deinococcus gobiensis I-0]
MPAPRRYGPSPRLWGTLVAHDVAGQRRRSIPTPVGNTHYPQQSRTRGAVHPHACGEHFFEALTYDCAVGPSPRLWGTPSYD